MKVTFGKGKYFIGDICYALADIIYDNIWGKVFGYKEGCYELGKLKFAVDGTRHGDGCYIGNDGVEYGVDAGVIGVVPAELFDEDKPTGGRIIKVKKELVFESNSGYFKFVIDGNENITINTR